LSENKVEQLASWRHASSLEMQNGSGARFITLQKAAEALKKGAPEECRDRIGATFVESA
jgi:hypothetical protein